MQPVMPFRANQLVRSVATDTYGPSPPDEHIYQDINAFHTESYKRAVPLRPPPPAPLRPANRNTQPPKADINRGPPPGPWHRPRLPTPSSPHPQLYERTLPHQTSAPGLQRPPEFEPVYEELKIPPPAPPRTYMYISRPNLAPGSSSRPPETYTPLANELPTPDIPTGGPRRNAPPPRPPPPLVKRPSLTPPIYSPSSTSPYASSSGHSTEPLYDEAEGHVYLDILPDMSRRYAEFNSLLEYGRIGVYDYMPPGPEGHSGDDQTSSSFNQKAFRVMRALNRLKIHLDDLQQHISVLTALCDKLDKKLQKGKSMEIAGATTGTVGGAAALVGIVLAPATMGISLVITAIGAGMVATGSGMGAHTVITGKKKAMKKVTMEKILRDYKKDIVDAECCSLVIRSEMGELRRYDCSKLRVEDVLPEALRMAQLPWSLPEKDTSSASGICPTSTAQVSSFNVLQAFSREMDLYFTESNGQTLKKSNAAMFASKVRQLARDLQKLLDELNQTWKMFSS